MMSSTTSTKFTLTDEQVAICEAVATGKHLFINALAGSSKAQPYDSLVLTPTGYTKIGDIRVGDKVLSATSGLPVSVVAVHPRGVTEVYRVDFSDKTSVRCSPDHLWTVRPAGRSGNGDRLKLRTLPLSEIMKDYIIPYKKPISRYSVEPIAPKVGGVAFPDAYLLGLLLGDGCFSRSVATLTCGGRDAREIINILMGDYTFKVNYRADGTVVIRFLWHELPESLHKYRNSGLSADKHVIDNFYAWDYESQLALLAGLHDSDGCAKLAGNGRLRLRFSVLSKRLAETFTELVRLTGGFACFSFYARGHYKTGDGGIYRVTYRHPRMFSRIHHKQWDNNRTYFNDAKITNIERLEDAPTICISIDAADGLYITDNVKATHNSSTAQVYSQSLPKALTLYTTFNTANIKDAIAKNVNAECRGLHSIGFKALAAVAGCKLEVNDDKSAAIYKTLCLRGGVAVFQKAFSMYKLLGLKDARGWSEAQDVLGSNHGIHDSVYDATKQILELNDTMFREHGIVDFADMLYLPPRHCKRGFLGYKHIIVDEVFDLSEASLDLLRHGMRPGTQLIFCGDVNQSIYECFGASGEAVLEKVQGWETRSLSLSFRCKEAIAEVARQFVPEFRAYNPGGVVTFPEEGLRATDLTAGSLVIATKYANLIPLFVDAVKAGRRVSMRGVELITSVTDSLKKLESRHPHESMDGLLDHYIADLDIKLAKLPMTLKNEAKRKKLGLLLTVAPQLKDSFNRLDEAIVAFGSVTRVKEPNAELIFSSVHRAKGAEADTVYFLDYPEVFAAWAQDGSEALRKVLFVGVTRAKTFLHLGC